MSSDGISLSNREFEAVKSRIYAFAGISLSDAKRTLVISRLTKLVLAKNLTSFEAYVSFLDQQATGKDKQDFVNALTTNLTRFYREDHHFAHLETYVAELMAGPKRHERRPKLRIWSAGCSTGQEPYTIGMCLMTKFPALKNWDFRILATDVDTGVLAQAATGVYKVGDLSGLSDARARVFERESEALVRIPTAVRNLVHFKPLNLMQDWPMSGPFDAIFCRNVAIYFDRQTQENLFRRLGEKLADNSYLYIGHSENIPTGTSGFTLKGKTIYHYSHAHAQALAHAQAPAHRKIS